MRGSKTTMILLLLLVIELGLVAGVAKWGSSFLLCLSPAVLWLLLSIKIVGPAERAVKVIMGEPESVCSSGFRFLPWFFGTRLVRYPTKLYNLVFPTREIVSRAGVYGTPSVSYGAQTLRVDPVVYLRFPRDGRLIEVLRASVPTDEKELLDWAEEAVVGALRIALGQMTWREATEDIGEVIRRVNEVFTRQDGALVQTGFDPAGIQLTIKEIRLPKELEAALPQIDHARLRAEAAQSVAQERATETVGMVLEALAQARGKTRTEIQYLINRDKKLQQEFLLMARGAWERDMAAKAGALVDIRVNGAGGGLEEILLQLAAAWQRMPTGGGGSSSSPSPGETPPGSPQRETPGETLERINRKIDGEER